MSNFEIALKRALAFEGGFSNDPNDKGGMTFCGISRKAWPDWSGWAIVDGAIENGVDVKTYAHQNALFMAVHVAPFYLKNFWLPIRGDEIESQDIANYLFDFAVNSGVRNAVKCLQRAVSFEGSDVDGIIGLGTLMAVNRFADLQAFKEQRILFLADAIGDGRIHHSLTDGLIRRALA